MENNFYAQNTAATTRRTAQMDAGGWKKKDLHIMSNEFQSTHGLV